MCERSSFVGFGRSLSINFISAGGRRCKGAPSNEALPCTPGKRACIACACAPSRAAGGALTFVHFPSHLVIRRSSVSDVARGRNRTPGGSFQFVFACHCLWAGILGTEILIPFSLASSSSTSSCFMSIHPGVRTALHQCVCVCVYMCFCVCVCVCAREACS